MRGLTLIEMMIYLAVLVLFITSAASAGYGLLQDVGMNSARLTSEDDRLFLISKLSWALSSAAAAPTAHGLVLSIPMEDPVIDPVEFRFDPESGILFARMGAGQSMPLTASSSVTDVTFAAAATGTRVTAIVNGIPFALVRTPAL